VLVTALGSWEKTVPRGHLIMPYTTVRASLGSDGEEYINMLCVLLQGALKFCPRSFIVLALYATPAATHDDRSKWTCVPCKC
jgi:hypothetical protein